MARVRRAILTGTGGSWRWALLLLWPFACLNPMPDDFPNQHEEDRADSPVDSAPTPGVSPDQGSPPPNAEAEGPADALGEDEALAAPDAGAPRADAGTEEDDVSP
jgi:hypothetical protein